MSKYGIAHIFVTVNAQHGMAHHTHTQFHLRLNVTESYVLLQRLKVYLPSNLFHIALRLHGGGQTCMVAVKRSFTR